MLLTRPRSRRCGRSRSASTRWRRRLQPAPRRSSAALRSGLAFEVGDLVGLGVGAVLRAVELLLGLALALLAAPLLAQARVIGQVARSLLRAAGQLVEQAHRAPPSVRWDSRI